MADTAAAPEAAADPSATPPAADPAKKRHTFGAPRGTVRGLLALCVAGSAYWLIANPDLRATHYENLLPQDLLGALLIVLGYYFADRAANEDVPQVGKPPIWLPAGTVRALLVVGFLASVGWLIYQRYQPEFSFFALPAAGIIINISAFFLGRLGRAVVKGFHTKGKEGTAAVIGDIKGLIGLAAGAGTVVVYCMPELNLQYMDHDLRGRFLELFPGLISFYFGSR